MGGLDFSSRSHVLVHRHELVPRLVLMIVGFRSFMVITSHHAAQGLTHSEGLKSKVYNSQTGPGKQRFRCAQLLSPPQRVRAWHACHSTPHSKLGGLRACALELRPHLPGHRPPRPGPSCSEPDRGEFRN